MTWQPIDYSHLSETEAWSARARELESLVDASEPIITGLANAAAYINEQLPNINWAGFYLFDGEKLILGPFIGRPACTTIPMGKGVCGTAADRRTTVVVDDVEQFPGHIACDDASKSEVVVPILGSGGQLYGVLDVDSPQLARFDQATVRGLEQLVQILSRKLNLSLRDRLFI